MLEFISDCISPGRTGKIIRYSLTLLIIGSLTTCKKEEVATKEYPRLNTLEVTGINESGAVFNAEIISGKLEDIIEYGFVWDICSNLEIESNDKQVTTGAINGKKFSGEYSFGFDER